MKNLIKLVSVVAISAALQGCITYTAAPVQSAVTPAQSAPAKVINVRWAEYTCGKAGDKMYVRRPADGIAQYRIILGGDEQGPVRDTKANGNLQLDYDAHTSQGYRWILLTFSKDLNNAEIAAYSQSDLGTKKGKALQPQATAWCTYTNAVEL